MSLSTAREAGLRAPRTPAPRLAGSHCQGFRRAWGLLCAGLVFSSGVRLWDRQRQSPGRRAGTAEAPVNTGIALSTVMSRRHELREQAESADRIAEWPSPLIAGTRRRCSPLIVRTARPVSRTHDLGRGAYKGAGNSRLGDEIPQRSQPKSSTALSSGLACRSLCLRRRGGPRCRSTARSVGPRTGSRIRASASSAVPFFAGAWTAPTTNAAASGAAVSAPT